MIFDEDLNEYEDLGTFIKKSFNEYVDGLKKLKFLHLEKIK